MKFNDVNKIEESVLKFWKDREIFEKTLENRRSANRGNFVFFEGPPYANGRPGIHHFLGRVIKDLFIRYKTMRGYFIGRKAGWDTHGLPIEIEAEKRLGIKSKNEIEKIGIGVFNRKAKESIWEYKEEWERFTHRIGFWLDLKHPYITYEPNYIETIWWIMSQISKRKLLCQGHKVLPWCPRCGTALASHEVAQGYEDVTETSVYVKFKLKPSQKIGDFTTDDRTYALAWTTTPWTLPGNVALAIAEKIKYTIVQKNGENLIAARTLAEKVIGAGEFLKEFSGNELVGLEYEPLFDISHLQTKTAYKIYPADFVNTDEGTGIVHTAVMYGEDDYELGTKLGLPKHHTVDEQGRFNEEVAEFKGQFVKDAEKEIVKLLENRGLLFKTEEYTHSYPFCWRCKSPLIYYARDSWFIAMSKLRKRLVKNNSKVHWTPAHLKYGRFGEFIKEAKDWAISRERYWGASMPIWKCEKCGETKVISSLNDLEKYRFRPKNTYYILRHGTDERGDKTEAKLENDHSNLLPEGIEEINKIGKKLKGKAIDLIFSSPFKRTFQSAGILAKRLGLGVNVDERLKELDHGTMCEGKKHIVCLPPDTKITFETKFGDGESWQDVKIRMSSFLNELDRKYENKKILIVGHGDPLWILAGFAKNLSNKETIDQRIPLYLKKGQLKMLTLKNFPHNEAGDIDLHRPYVDEIELKCSKCKNKMKRIKEVIDVWFDSGAMPYAQWHYPFDNKRIFAKNFPADFIAEGIDQTRGWFYTLLAVSTVLGRGAPYKNVVSYNHVLDEKGKKMSKSVGNVVDPWDVIEKYGVDAVRWYFYTINDPADPKLFSENDISKKLNGFLMTLLNSVRFLELYTKSANKKFQEKPVTILDYWILSRLNGLIENTTKLLDDYNFTPAARAIEAFTIEDLSNWWIRRSRECFQKPKNAEELKSAAQFLRFLLSQISKLSASLIPFVAEHIYKQIDNRKESVHLEDWPTSAKKYVNLNLEKEMLELRNFAADGLAQRKSLGIKVRQPLRSISLKREKRFDPELEKLLTDELNVKTLVYDNSQEETAKLDAELTPELIIEGYAREIVRQIQDMRKEAKYKLDEKIISAWESDDPDVVKTIQNFGKEVANDTLIKDFSRGHQPNAVFDVEKDIELAPQAKIWLGVRN